MQQKSFNRFVRDTLCVCAALSTTISIGATVVSAKTKVVTTTTTKTSTVHKHPVSTRKRRITRVTHSKNTSRNYMINTIQQAARTK